MLASILLLTFVCSIGSSENSLVLCIISNQNFLNMNEGRLGRELVN